MNITAQNHDDVSALLTVTIDRSDYKDNVEKQLADYAKKIQIPGFRKGKVPLNLVRKQYEAGIAFDEINKQVSDALNHYINENKLKLMGQPIPQPVENFDHNADQISVTFEVGYEPFFMIDLAKYEVPYYKVEPSEKEISEGVENLQIKFAEEIPRDEIGEDSYVELQISQVVEPDATGEHHHHPKYTHISKDRKTAFDLVKHLKKGESVKISKEKIQSDETLAKELGFSKQETEHFHHDELEITVENIYDLKLPTLDQDFFDKVYKDGNITSEQDLRNIIKYELEGFFRKDSDVHFVNETMEQIIDNENIQLPETFLVKWLMYSDPKIQTEERAKEIFESEKRSLKFQIVQNRLTEDFGIKLENSDVISRAEQMIKNQFAAYGLYNLKDEELQKYALDMLQNRDQAERIASEALMDKLKDIILKKVSKKETSILRDEFLKMVKAKDEFAVPEFDS
ncbi:MAG: trigger factor [Flavobacteriaceae bacterium]|jgi:trigger factor|nr:trigger factor [Flavobacteriaceae bacterium]